MKFLNFLLCMAGIVLACYACSKDEVKDEGNTGSPIITIPESENPAPVFTTAGGSTALNFKATADWSATVVNTRADSWISVQPSSGAAGDITITITTTGNDSYDDRNATIQLICGNDVKTITVTQKQKNALTLTTARYEVKQQGDIIKAEVKANISFSVEIPDAYKSWITQQSPTRALESNTLTFKIEPNLETTLREGEIIVRETGGTLTETLKVYQTGGDIIILSQRNYVVASNGETIGVEIKSNVENYNATLPQVNWISENSTRSVSTNTLYYTIAPNETYESREAKIIYSSGTATDTVTIRQVQKGALAIAQDKFDIAGTGGQFSVKLSTNEKFNVEIPVSTTWLHQITTRSLENHTLNFSVDTNTTTEARSAVIKIKSETQTGSITVKQAGHSEVSFSSDTIRVPSAAVAKEFSMMANSAWTLKSNNENWCTVSPVQGNKGTYTIRVSITENTSMLEARKTTLTAKIDTMAWSITVIQDRKEPDPNINKGIRTLDDLINFRDAVNAGKDISEWKYNGEINLLADIDLSYVENWEPIGYWRSDRNANPFTGIFNGNGYTIKNLKINSNAQTVGFFGYNSGIIKGVKLENIYINGHDKTTGGICARNFVGTENTNGKIINCLVTGFIKGSASGGICGSNENKGTIQDCINQATIYGIVSGGICGKNSIGCTISSCTNEGVVVTNEKNWICGYNNGTLKNNKEDGKRFLKKLYDLILGQYDSDKDEQISLDEFAKVFKITCSNEYLQTLDGLEFCSNLTFLDCSNNILNNLDIKLFPELRNLNCSNNDDLQNLDLTSCKKITSLICYRTGIKTLDITNCPELHNLSVSTAIKLTGGKDMTLHYYSPTNNKGEISINLNNCPQVTKLIFEDSDGNYNLNNGVALENIEFTKAKGSYNLNGCTRLKEIYFSSTTRELKKLNVSNCQNLIYLTSHINKNTQIIDFNASNCIELTSINSIIGNKTENIDLSGCINLANLPTLSKGNLKTLNLSGCKKIFASTKIFDCSENQLTSLNLGDWSLTSLDCSTNRLDSLDISKQNKLVELNCYKNRLTSLDVSKHTNLITLNCNNNQLNTLNVSTNNNLNHLNCSDNKITELNVSKNISLKLLLFGSNPLKTLNLGDLDLITTLGSASSPLNTLDSKKITIIGNKLTGVYLHKNKLENLDITACPMLEILHCYSNQISTLDIKNHSHLKELKCYSNQISSLDFSVNQNLTTCEFNDNPLSYLNTGNLSCITKMGSTSIPFQLSTSTSLTVIGTKIEEIFIQKSNLKSVDFTQCPELTTLHCYFSQISVLDISKNSKLQELKCYTNKISRLDFSKNNNITNCEFENNPLTYLNTGELSCITSIGLGANPFQMSSSTTFTVIGSKIQTIHVVGSNLTNIDVSMCPILTALSCGGGSIQTLNVSKCSMLRSLWCTNNKLTSLNMSGCTSLTQLECYSNQLTSINVSECQALSWFRCYSNQLTELDVSKCSKLTTLDCSSNQLRSFYIPECPELKKLNCSSNQLTTLDVSAPVLPELNCSSNQLTSLNIAECSSLTLLDCSSNKLTTVNISNNLKLQNLICSNNELPVLNLLTNKELIKLDCTNNLLTELDVSGGWDMSYIYCEGNPNLKTIYTAIYKKGGSQSWQKIDSIKKPPITTMSDKIVYLK